MGKDIIVSLDCGTSKIKALALTVQGRTLASADVANTYIVGKGGAVEQNLLLTWKKVAFVFQELIRKIPNLSSRALMITITGQGDGTWLIDKKGAPVGNAFLWLDSRAAQILKSLIARNVHRTLFPLTGSHINACNQSTQLLWLKKHAPSLLKRVHTAFHCKEWIYFKLTKERVCDVSEACFTFGNFRTLAYEDDIFRILGLKSVRSIFPRIISGESEYHALEHSAAKSLGLTAGTPVVLGYVDVSCSAIGAGVFSTREVRSCSIIGSTGIHIKAYPHYQKMLRENDLKKVPSGYSIVLPQKHSVMRVQSNMAATLNFDWMARVLTDGIMSVYRNQSLFKSINVRDFLIDVDKDILRAQAAKILYHPYIDTAGERGPFNDTSARAQFLGLDQSLTHLDLLRAVYEGVGYATRHCYEAMGKIPKTIYLSGGGFSSNSFSKIFASILNIHARKVSHQETGAMGAAMIGCLSLGVYSSLNDACKKVIEPYISSDNLYGTPDPALRSQYDKMFKLYKEAISTNQTLWNKLNALHS